MIHTENDDDGFALIERENSMKGQPYNWEADAIKAAIRIEREACAELCEMLDVVNPKGKSWDEGTIDCANAIRARGQVT